MEEVTNTGIDLRKRMFSMIIIFIQQLNGINVMDLRKNILLKFQANIRLRKKHLTV